MPPNLLPILKKFEDRHFRLHETATTKAEALKLAEEARARSEGARRVLARVVKLGWDNKEQVARYAVYVYWGWKAERARGAAKALALIARSKL